MDYSDDSCLNTFTDGQITRMKSAYEDKRINYTSGDGSEELDPLAAGNGPHGG